MRLSEASARIRLSDTVTVEDVNCVTGVVESVLADLGVDPETEQFDADVVEPDTDDLDIKEARKVKRIISTIEEQYEEGAPIPDALEQSKRDLGITEQRAAAAIEMLRKKGKVYEPRTDHLRTT